MFLVGAGVEDNAWAPVVSAIKEYAPDMGVQDREDAAFYLAHHVYQLRFYHRHQTHPRAGEDGPKLAKQALRDDIELKTVIADHLRRAVSRGDLHLTDKFMEFVNGSDWGSTAFLTTNWDMLAEENYGQSAEATLHIHGDVREPRLRYLPTEMAAEEYRRPEDHERMGVFMGATWGLVSRTKRLVVAGCALSADDIELARTLSVGLSDHSEKPCEVVIYNLRRDLERVRRRICMFNVPNLKLTFRFIDAKTGEEVPV